MATLADMKARIASEMFRSDISTQIAAAITEAIAVYQMDRFKFMDMAIGSEPTFNTVPTQQTYTAADAPFLASIPVIDYITYVQAGIVFVIDRDRPLAVKVGNQNLLMQGQPQSFTYVGQALTLYPVPNQVWTISVGGQQLIAAPATDAEANNPWMNDAERLIRCRAKYIIARHVTRNPDLAKMLSPDPPSENEGVVGETYRAYKELKAAYNKIRGKGRVAPMHF